MVDIIELKTETTTVEKKIGFLCDSCNDKILFNSLRTDNFKISYGCGYGTEHDGTHIEVNLCDNCLVELIKNNIPKARITNQW